MKFRQGRLLAFCTILFALSTQTTIAQSLWTPNSEVSFRNGFYGGFLVGEGFAHADWDGANTVAAMADDFFAQGIFQAWTPQGQSNQQNFAGRVFVGYNLVQSNLYLGGEIGGTFAQTYSFDEVSSMHFTSAPITVGDFTQINHATAATSAIATLSGSEFNLDIKPGIIFANRVLVYARAGLAFNKLNLTDSGAWTQQAMNEDNPSTPLFATGSSTSSNNVVGLKLGLGLECLVTKHLGVLVDYTYTNYGKVETISQGSASPPAPLAFFDLLYGTDAPVVTISAQTAMVGLNYHF